MMHDKQSSSVPEVSRALLHTSTAHVSSAGCRCRGVCVCVFFWDSRFEIWPSKQTFP